MAHWLPVVTAHGRPTTTRLEKKIRRVFLLVDELPEEKKSVRVTRDT